MKNFPVFFALLGTFLATASGAVPGSDETTGTFVRYYYVPGGTGPGCVAPLAPEERPLAQQILERAGLKFRSDCWARYFPAQLVVAMRNTDDQHVLAAAYFESLDSVPFPQISIIFERIAVKRAFLEDWLFENALDRDATELRMAIQQRVRNDRAQVLDTVVVLARSGQRAKVESISNFIYPTETDVEFPGTEGDVLAPITKKKKPSIVFPTVYEARHVGIILKVDPLISADGDTVDLHVLSEVVKITGFFPVSKDGLPLELSSRMPIFSKEEVDTAVTVRHGRYAFLGSSELLKGTDDSIVLNFIRADVAGVIQ